MGPRLVLGAIVLLGLTASTLAGPAEAPAGGPPIIGLPRFGFKAAGAPAGQYAFTAEREWTRFWSRYSGEPAPRVDFSQWQVVAILLGERPNPGYAVEVMDYAVEGGKVVVHYQEVAPAPGSVWTQVISYPADVVAVPAGRPVCFVCAGGRRSLMPPVARDLGYRALDLTGLSAAIGEQFLAFTGEAAWQQFWSREGRGRPPAVDFAGGYMAAGVVGLQSRSGVTVSGAQRAGDRITVTLGPGGPGCTDGPGQRSVVLVLPRAPRVDFALGRFCR